MTLADEMIESMLAWKPTPFSAIVEGWSDVDALMRAAQKAGHKRFQAEPLGDQVYKVTVWWK